MSQPVARPNGHLRILIVEDDESIQELIAAALTDEGFQIEIAPHGAAALDLIPEFPPDLILLDMRMPVMDGRQFARAYRRQPGPHAPIVVLTAGRDARELAAQVSAQGYLAKPFLLADLLRAVDSALATRNRSA